AWHIRTLAELLLGRFAEATTSYETGLSSAVTSRFHQGAYLAVGARLALVTGDPVRALELARDACDTPPTAAHWGVSTELHLVYGAALHREGSRDGAQQQLEDALYLAELHRDRARTVRALLHLAVLYAELGEQGTAAHAKRRAMRI